MRYFNLEGRFSFFKKGKVILKKHFKAALYFIYRKLLTTCLVLGWGHILI